jgi:hypothetical protein
MTSQRLKLAPVYIEKYFAKLELEESRGAFSILRLYPSSVLFSRILFSFQVLTFFTALNANS